MRYEDSLELRFNVWLDVWICGDCEAQAHIPRRPGQRDRVKPACPNPDCGSSPAAHWSRASAVAAAAASPSPLPHDATREDAERAAAAARDNFDRREAAAAERLLGETADHELGDRQAGEAAAAATATTRSMLAEGRDASDELGAPVRVHLRRLELAGEDSGQSFAVHCPTCGAEPLEGCTFADGGG